MQVFRFLKAKLAWRIWTNLFNLLIRISSITTFINCCTYLFYINCFCISLCNCWNVFESFCLTCCFFCSLEFSCNQGEHSKTHKAQGKNILCLTILLELAKSMNAHSMCHHFLHKAHCIQFFSESFEIEDDSCLHPRHRSMDADSALLLFTVLSLSLYWINELILVYCLHLFYLQFYHLFFSGLSFSF